MSEPRLERNLRPDGPGAKATAQPSPHTVLCLNGPCPADCAAAIAQGLPREPDWTLEVPGQLTIDAALEDAS